MRNAIEMDKHNTIQYFYACILDVYVCILDAQILPQVTLYVNPNEVKDVGPCRLASLIKLSGMAFFYDVVMLCKITIEKSEC